MPTPIRSKEYFRNLNLIYLAQISAITILAIAAYYLISNGNLGKENSDLAVTFQKIIMIVIPVSFTAGYLVFRFILRRIPQSSPIQYKMKRYFVAYLIRSAFMELPGLFVSVAAMATAQNLFLVIVPLILIMFILFRPTKSVVAQELNLAPAERTLIANPEAKISESLE